MANDKYHQAMQDELTRPSYNQLEAQLTTTLSHLKAVLGESDTDGNEFFCVNCGKLAELITLFCTNNDCPRYKARQHVKEMESKV